MSSTLNVTQSMVWAGAYTGYQPLAIGSMDPALSNANLVKQTMLGAPFVWPWNRNETNPIACVAGTQDYPTLLPDFGFIEKAWITIGGVVTEIRNKSSLGKDATPGRPDFIAAQRDDNAGTITFRLTPCPNQPYILTVAYQIKSSSLTSLASTWSPIPDELAYIFNYGFLALAMMVTDDDRFPIFNDRFVAHLLGAQDGLDEMQRNIFLGNWLDVMKQTQRSGMMAQQGAQSRTK